MKIALAQQNYHIGNFEKNRQKIIDGIGWAKQQRADLVVFSELCICGYPPRDFLEFDDFINKCYESIDIIKQHDVVGIKVYDKMDMELPKIGMVLVRDAESGNTKWVDTNSAFVREQYQQEFFRVTEYSTNVFKKAGCDLLHVRTGDDYVKVLQRFFVSRNR